MTVNNLYNNGGKVYLYNRNIICIFVVDYKIINMFLGFVYDITPDKLEGYRIRQKEFSKKITKMLKNRTFVSSHENYMRITFRIVSILPHTEYDYINDYRLNIEITKVEEKVYDGEWTEVKCYRNQRVYNYEERIIKKELSQFLLIFGLSMNRIPNYAYVKLSNPKLSRHI